MLSWHKRFIRNPHWPFIASGLVLALIGLRWILAGPGTAQIDSFNQCANAGYPLTNTNPPACDTGSGFMLGPAAPSSSPVMAQSQSFQLLVEGNSGGTYPKANQIITTEGTWQSYWQAVHAGLHTTPPILPINFATSDVITLSAGPEATDGYTLEVTGVTTSAAGSEVGVAESIPTITCGVHDTPTDPYFIASTARLPQPVTFSVDITRRECPQ